MASVTRQSFLWGFHMSWVIWAGEKLVTGARRGLMALPALVEGGLAEAGRRRASRFFFFGDGGVRFLDGETGQRAFVTFFKPELLSFGFFFLR